MFRLVGECVCVCVCVVVGWVGGVGFRGAQGRELGATAAATAQGGCVATWQQPGWS